MSIEYAPKSDLELTRMAADFLRKHPHTSGLEVKSLRVRNYDRLSADAIAGAFLTSYYCQKMCITFSMKGEPHVAEIVIEDRRHVLVSAIKARLIYAVLDGHYDLLSNAEIWQA